MEASPDVNPRPIGAGREEQLRQSMRAGKSAAKDSGYSRPDRRGKSVNTRGFLSIGRVKIYTNDISDTSDDEDSCADQMKEGFADEVDGYVGLSKKAVRGNKRGKGRFRRKNHSSRPDRTTFSAIMLDSSDGDDSYESSDSDISEELVEDYLANCEGLSADIDDPSWVIRNQKSLQYPHIDEMDVADEESDISGKVDLDTESQGLAGIGSRDEFEGEKKHRYRITSSAFGRQVIRRKRNEEKTVLGESDIEAEDLEQKAIFGYDSDSSSTGEDDVDALLFDDEVRIRDLELDDEARIRDLELQDDTSANAETTGVLVSESVNTGFFWEASVNRGVTGAFVSDSMESILPTSSVGTQTLPANTDEAHEDNKFAPCRSNMLPKYRFIGQFVSGLAEEVSLTSPVAAQAWPVSTGKTVKKSKGVPGQKRMERQKTITQKRRERAVKRGFDVAAVNKELEEMVRRKKDVIAFEPMEQRDRAMVHTLAKIYRLKGSSQGTTKRRFVVVSITQNTSMPSGEDRVRLLKLLDKYKYPAVETVPTSSRTMTGEEQRKLSKMKRVAHQALHGLETPVSKRLSTKTPDANCKGRSGGKSRGKKGNSTPSGQASQMKRSEKKASKTAVLYANNPVSFIGKGIEGEDACITPASTGSSTPASVMEGTLRPRLPKADAGSSGSAGRKSKSSEFAGFEAHTNGFASRIMAKMGYIEGRGLGREKQGIAQPVEAVIRPRSLGLGARA